MQSTPDHFSEYETVLRRLEDEAEVYRAVSRRITLLSLLTMAHLTRAAFGERAAFVELEESDQHGGGMWAMSVVDAEGTGLAPLDVEPGGVEWEDEVSRWNVEVEWEDEVAAPASNLQPHDDTWKSFAVDDGTGRNIRLDIDQILSELREVPQNFVLVVPDDAWDWCGDEEQDPSRRTRATATITINGVMFHLDAWLVKDSEPFETQEMVEGDSDVDAIHGAVYADGSFETVTIEGREYVLVATPYC